MGIDWSHLLETGPGTIAGAYLRSYWQPVYRTEDVAPGQIVPIRIMGEDLALFRGESGEAKLVEARCAHRRTLLHTGWVDGDNVRCRYHGWVYDGDGQCVEQPGEVEGFAAKVSIKAYPTQEYLQLIWAYMGEGAPPPIRRFPDFEGEGVVTAGAPERWPCNLFNRLDNAADLAHVTFTHKESSRRRGTSNMFTKVPDYHAVETESGVMTTIEFDGRPVAYFHFHMPNANQIAPGTGDAEGFVDSPQQLSYRMFIRVPVDDENTVSFPVQLVKVFGEEAEAFLAQRKRAEAELTPVTALPAAGEKVLSGELRIEDMDRRFNSYYSFLIEDYTVQVGQGTVADRENEQLGRVDVGLILMRKIWEREVAAFADGRPTKAWTIPEGISAKTMALREGDNSRSGPSGQATRGQGGRVATSRLGI